MKNLGISMNNSILSWEINQSLKQHIRPQYKRPLERCLRALHIWPFSSLRGRYSAFQLLSPIDLHDQQRDVKGKVCYGLAAFYGLWVIDECHNFIGGGFALFDQNVVKCFYPTPSKETNKLIMALSVGIGVLCSMLFVAFPTKHNGIDFPLSAH
ncbi:hypothetical protein HHK36_001816 [Tetracentron sinense]|uniref:Uncharacterized protein n=1 Tax=Tetracentron sinense TaxID=13715 RepID=A0A835DVC6_TETSI|nr:hypothetical protein HHK36_001816 [Tetracentron sinense]